MAQLLYGIIGYPIKHSLSPAMHNASFKAQGLDCKYSAFEIKPEDLAGFMSNAKKTFAGFNVTIPHKQEVLKYMDVLDETARLTGAVNTVKVEEGSLYGYNTDGSGALDSLSAAGEKIKNQRVLIVGAGGAARAIAFSLSGAGAELVLTNRDTEKAIKLSKDIKEGLGHRVLVVNYTEKSLDRIMDEIDVVINATSVGMNPDPDRMPLTPSLLKKDQTVMDIVYNPLETRLLFAAKKTGCKTINGAGMLVCQGARSEKIWLGKDAPIDVMEKAVLERL